MMKKAATVLITGDYCPIYRVNRMIEQENIEGIFNDILPIISDSDISITNLEAPVTSTQKKILKSGPVLQLPGSAISVLKKAGFSLVTLANNHIMDLGSDGLFDTIDECRKNGLRFVGAGTNNEEARQYAIFEVNGLKIAFVNIAENEFGTTSDSKPGAAPLDPVRNRSDIIEAKKNSDFCFVIVHGGHEMYELPSPRMVETYRFFVESGADVVVGHHTHCVSGYEFYQSKPIFYSLGNFIFDSQSNKTDLWTIGLAVKFSLELDSIAFELIPFRQNGELPGLKILDDSERNVVISRISRLSEILTNHYELSKAFDHYCLSVSKMYGSFLEPYRNKYIHALRTRGIIPSVFSDFKKKLILNIIRCEAHRDVILKILSK